MTGGRDDFGVRIVQLSDTHLSVRTGVPGSLRALLDWIRASPPDLVVHTGDVVWEDPDDAADRSFAHEVLCDVPCPVVAIPGNHDVGFFEQDLLDQRLAAFRATWGDDRFVIDTDDGWRLVGVDVYTVGHAAVDEWVASVLDTLRPTALFVHQPLDGEPVDGWQLPDDVRVSLGERVAAADVHVVASGHRHCGVVRTLSSVAHVWAPSTTLTGKPYHGGDPTPGAVEYRFEPGGGWSYRFVGGGRTLVS